MKKLNIILSIIVGFMIIGCGESTANITGEAFLRTNGGSVITCAGSLVYLEKANEEGYAYLTNILTIKEEYLNVANSVNTIERVKRSNSLASLESKFPQDIDKVAYWEKALKNSSSDTAKSFIKEQLTRAKEEMKTGEKIRERREREENMNKIRKLKEENEKKEKEESSKLLIVKKEISKLEERLKNITKENTKETMCNSHGEFNFTGLSPDSYYISTTVEWFSGDKKQGGIVSKTVTLKEGENKIFINK